VLALADDIGWGDFAPWNAGSRVPSPHIDALAERGTVFTRAYSTASVCAPSRYSVLTGNNCHRGSEPWGQWKYPAPSNIQPGQSTLGSLLRQAGYATAFLGKWHMGGGIGRRHPHVPERAPFGPLAYGFNVSLSMPKGIQGSPFAFRRDDRDTWGRSDGGGSIRELLPCDAKKSELPLAKSIWVSDVGPCLAKRAAAYIRELPEPFFVFYSSQSTHAPFIPPARFLDMGPVAGRTGLGAQADMLYEFDLAVGVLARALDARGVTDRSIVMVTSDNGAACSGLTFKLRAKSQICPLIGGVHAQVGGLRGFKGTPFEGGLRVPLLLAGGAIPAGLISDAFIAMTDVIKTLALAGGALLTSPDAVDGLDLRAALLHGAGAVPRAAATDASAALPSFGVARESLNASCRSGAWTSYGDEAWAGRTMMLAQSGGAQGYFYVLYVAQYKWTAEVRHKGACAGQFGNALRLQRCMLAVKHVRLVDMCADPFEVLDVSGLPSRPSESQLRYLLEQMLRRPETHTLAAKPVAQLFRLSAAAAVAIKLAGRGVGSRSRRNRTDADA
jgi:arylsulfatase A-like enzyme